MNLGLKKTLTILAAAAWIPTTAMAVDGVVLLDQNKALAGGVTPGDAPGFPITISQPGSYRLDGNLTVPQGGTAITITVPNVTIDLNGFSLITTPSQVPASFGITYTGPLPARTITIRNGHINGFVIALDLGSTYDPTTIIGFTNGAEASLQDLYLSTGIPGLSAGILLGANSRVTNVSAITFSFSVACPTTISNSVLRSVSTQNGRCTIANTGTTF